MASKDVFAGKNSGKDESLVLAADSGIVASKILRRSCVVTATIERVTSFAFDLDTAD
jgi:hypothetical protein